MLSDVPDNLDYWMNMFGVVKPKKEAEPEPLEVRTYEYRPIQLDANGEPPF